MIAFAVAVAEGGSLAVLRAVPMALVYTLAIIGGSFLVSIAAAALLTRRNRDSRPAGACPCCTHGPLTSTDCTCREDCGAPMCQAAEVGDDTIAMLREDDR